MDLLKKKEALIKELIEQGILKRKDIADAFSKIRREEFVPKHLLENAYDNHPLPIGEGQTISQPLTVAFMTEALDPRKGHKILEVGTGSGYQAALLAEVTGRAGRIITLERLGKLADMARTNLTKAGYENVEVVNMDGSTGYEKAAPYDRIIVTASAPAIPGALVKQLKKKGMMVITVGDEMFLVEKEDKIKKTFLGHFVFVPLIGKGGYK